MRLSIFLLVSCAACSSSTNEPSGALDAASPSDASSQDAASSPDTSAPDSAEASTGPNTGMCASCTATEDSKGGCLDELQQCGQSSDCLGNLKSFNDCLTAHHANCGTTLAAGGTSEAERNSSAER